jgi:hypothetical protein
MSAGVGACWRIPQLVVKYLRLKTLGFERSMVDKQCLMQ